MNDTTTPVSATSHQTRSKWATAFVAVGVPIRATTRATPIVEPIWRVAWLIAEPEAKRSAGRPCTAALDSCGRHNATPRPIIRPAGSQSDSQLGWALTRVRSQIWLTAIVRPPGTSNTRCPYLAANDPATGANAATTRGPGTMAKPARRIE